MNQYKDTGDKYEHKPVTERGSIVFYCKDCYKLTEVDKVGNRYVYKCRECKGKNVAFGTEASIKKFFHVQPDLLEKSSQKV